MYHNDFSIKHAFVMTTKKSTKKTSQTNIMRVDVK